MQNLATVARLRVPSGSVGTAPNSANCVRYWSFDSDYTDLTGNGNLTNNGSTLTTSVISNGAYFDGSNDEATFADINIFSSDYSVAFWYKPTTVSGTSAWVVNFRGESNMSFREISSNLQFKTFHPTPGEKTVTFTPSAGTQYFIVGTHSTANGMRLYVNGTLTSSDATATVLPTTSAVGSNSLGSFNGGSFSNNTLDEVSIYNTELTADNVTYLYQNGNPGSAQQYPFT